jgi:hypothetical protein
VLAHVLPVYFLFSAFYFGCSKGKCRA